MVGLSKYQLLSNTNPMESAPCLPPTRCGAGTVTSSHEGRTRGVPRHGLGGARLQAVAHPGRNHPVLALCNGAGGEPPHRGEDVAAELGGRPQW